MGNEPEETPVVVTDKRGQKKDDTVGMPTAEELLADDSTPSNPALAAQLAEERERLAAWEAMTDEERQAVLAQQAAEEQGSPFAGGGMQTPPDEHAGKKAVLTMFTIVVHRDGTAVASDNTDLSMFEPEFPVTSESIYRAICEIKKDIESTAAGTATVMAMHSYAAHAQQEAQARGLAEQLGKRGVATPPRRGRR